MRASPAAKVAAGPTALIAGVYIIAVIVLNLVVATPLTALNDNRLASRLTAARQDPAALNQRVPRSGSSIGAGGDFDADGAPVFLWSANAQGVITGHSPGAPALPAALLTAHPPRSGLAVTAN